MRVIITGGTGELGRPLAAALHAANHEVIILSRNPQRAAGFPAGVRVVAWDARSGSGWAEEINADTVIANFAGENIAGSAFLPERWSDAKRSRIRNSRVQVGEAVVDAVRRAPQKPRAVIQASGVNFYGAGVSDRLLDESAPAGTDFLASVCLDWEASTAQVTELGVRHVVTRTGLVLSPAFGPLKRFLVQFRLFAGGPFGSGKQYYSWIHLDDQVAATQTLIEAADAAGVYNLVAPNPVTNKSFATTLGRVLRRPGFIPVPAFAMRLLAGAAATLVLEGQRAVPRALLDAGFQFRYPELEQALRALVDHP